MIDRRALFQVDRSACTCSSAAEWSLCDSVDKSCVSWHLPLWSVKPKRDGYESLPVPLHPFSLREAFIVVGTVSVLQFCCT